MFPFLVGLQNMALNKKAFWPFRSIYRLPRKVDKIIGCEGVNEFEWLWAVREGLKIPKNNFENSPSRDEIATYRKRQNRQRAELRLETRVRIEKAKLKKRNIFLELDKSWK